LYHPDLDRSDSANAFFEVLHRLKAAYGDCKDMVEHHCYSVGFELLEILGQHQDRAYQHLLNGCAANVKHSQKTAPSTTSTQTPSCRSPSASSRNFRFTQCQDLLVNSRRTQLVQRFAVALTQGDTNTSITTAGVGSGAGGGKGGHHAASRALDLHAHDAARYVGGMLAWMHEAIASEQEFLEAIFGDFEAAERTQRPRSNAAALSGSNKAVVKADGQTDSPGDGGTNERDGTAEGGATDSNTSTGPGGKTGLTVPQLLSEPANAKRLPGQQLPSGESELTSSFHT
jgi:nucleoid DNA-binding protein